MERPNGGFGRGNGRDSNRRPQQPTSTDRPQQVRQEDEWSIPPNIERRDDVERHQTAQTSPPAAPPPTEERLFTDWSSEGSPRERVNQRVQLARSIESMRTELITADNEVIRHALSDVSTAPSAQVQTAPEGVRFIDRETNTCEMEKRPPREEVRTDIMLWPVFFFYIVDTMQK